MTLSSIEVLFGRPKLSRKGCYLWGEALLVASTMLLAWNSTDFHDGSEMGHAKHGLFWTHMALRTQVGRGKTLLMDLLVEPGELLDSSLKPLMVWPGPRNANRRGGTASYHYIKVIDTYLS